MENAWLLLPAIRFPAYGRLTSNAALKLGSHLTRKRLLYPLGRQTDKRSYFFPGFRMADSLSSTARMPTAAETNKFWKVRLDPTSILSGCGTENPSFTSRPTVNSPDPFGGNLSPQIHSQKSSFGRLRRNRIFIKPQFPRMAAGWPTFLTSLDKTMSTSLLSPKPRANGGYPPMPRPTRSGIETVKNYSSRVFKMNTTFPQSA